jgi:hypothetical protein
MDRTEEEGRELRLYGVLLGYLEAVERREAVDPKELLASHPEFAVELKWFLETHEWLERIVVGPNRRARRRRGLT